MNSKDFVRMRLVQLLTNNQKPLQFPDKKTAEEYVKQAKHVTLKDTYFPTNGNTE